MGVLYNALKNKLYYTETPTGKYQAIPLFGHIGVSHR